MVQARIVSFLVGFIMVFGISNAFAAVVEEDVDLGDGAVGRYRADEDGVSHIAFISIHRTGNYLNHQSSRELADRGFGTLGIRTRFNGDEAAVNWDLLALDIRDAVRFLREEKGHTKVILIGRSGGGPTTSYYQAVMENGVSYCKGSNKLIECPFDGTEFTPADAADGIAFTDAHPGIGINALRKLNASIVNESQPFGPAINKTLDAFREENGYNPDEPIVYPDGDSEYSDHFVQKYGAAQSRRMNKLIKGAQQLLATGASYDDPFVFYRVRARIPEFDLDIHGGTLNPAYLLKNNGDLSEEAEIIYTVRVPDISEKMQDLDSVEDHTILSFLSANAIRSKHSLFDLDWCSSNSSTVCAVREISVPILVLAHQGHYFIRDGEQIYEESASMDKEFVVVEGATHGGGNCGSCASYHGTGPYTNVTQNIYDYIANWANVSRFPPAP